MAIRVAGDEVYLEGDWTLVGVSQQIESLSHALQQIGSGTFRNLRIDCKLLSRADSAGLQLLYVWMECVRMRGVEPTMVNMPEKLMNLMGG